LRLLVISTRLGIVIQGSSYAERDTPVGQSRADGYLDRWLTYGGPYTFDGKKLVTSPDLASDPARMVDQVRGVRFEGGKMVLSPPPRPEGGKLGQQGETGQTKVDCWMSSDGCFRGSRAV